MNKKIYDELPPKYQKYYEQVQNFRLMDDTYMSIFFDNSPRETEFVLNIILDKDDIKVLEVTSQRALPNLRGHSVRLDVYATDSTGKKYNIEIQRSDKGGMLQRARYNRSLIDANVLDTGEEYKNLPDTYVIFITENDVLKRGLPKYTIEHVIKETGEIINDGTHIIYVNNSLQNGDTELGKLMQDFSCSSPADMNYPILAEKATELKETTKGVDTMCRAMEVLCDKAAVEAKREKSIDIAKALLNNGKNTIKEIAECTGLSLDEVKELAKTI